MIDSLIETERKATIMRDVLVEIKDELQDGWADEILGIGKKRKITPAEIFYSDEYPNVYESNPNYER